MSQTGPGAITCKIGARTDKGLQRTSNEDAFAVLDLPGVDAGFVVADGMGGLQAGEVASNEAVRVIEATLADSLSRGLAPRDALAESLERANTAVYSLTQGLQREQAALEEPTQKPGRTPPAAAGQNAVMGTTAVIGLVRDGVLHLAHAGDSRAYLLRGGTLRPLTEDHSFVAERVRAGDMTTAEARTSRFRNMITRAVGIDAAIEPEFMEQVLHSGDVVLACSDGLTTMLEDAEIADLLMSMPRSAPDRVCAALVDMANKKGGADNITVAVLNVEGPGDPGGGGSAAMPVSRRPQSRPAAAATSSSGASAGSRRVIDIDERRRGPALPLVALAAVGLATLGFGAAVAGSRSGRVRIGQALVGRPATSLAPEGTVKIKPLRDYSKLTYASPVPFPRREFITRGDLLAYSPNAGIFTVKESTGDLIYLSRGGDALLSVAQLEVAPPAPDPVPPSRVFIAADLQGNLYISYPLRKVVEKRSPEGGLLQKLSGFTRPEAIAVDEQGNIYVIDRNILKVLRAKDRQKQAPAPAATSRATPVSKPSK